MRVVQSRAARALSRYRPRGRDTRQDVEDLVQEIYLALFEQDGRVLKSWDPDRGLSLRNFVVSAAAAALLMLRSPRVEDLPSYSLSSRGGVDVQRGTLREGPLVFAPDSTLELVLRPQHDMQGSVAVRAFLRESGRVLMVHPEISPSGAMRIRAQASALFGDRKGVQEIVLVTCRPETCERALHEVQGKVAERGAGWQSLSQQVVLE
jgi:hypothetical protein